MCFWSIITLIYNLLFHIEENEGHRVFVEESDDDDEFHLLNDPDFDSFLEN